MQAKIELVATGSYADALKAGQAAMKKLANGAENITINARRLKKTGQWKVIIKYKRVVDKSQPCGTNEFFNITNN